MRKNFRINHYVSIIGLLALIPIMILGSILTNDIIQTGEHLKDQQNILVNDLGTEIKTFLDQHLLAIDTLARLVLEVSASPDELKKVLLEMNNSYEGFEEIYLEGPNYQLSSRLVAVPKEYRQNKEKLLMDNVNYSRFAALDKPFISPVLTGPTGEETIFVAVPIRQNNSTYSGYIMGTLRLSYLHNLLEKNKIYPSGYAVLVDGEHRLIDYPGKKPEVVSQDSLPVLKALSEKGSGTLEYFSPLNMRVEIAGFITIHDVGWGLWVTAPKKEVMQTQYRAAALSFALILLGVIVIMVIRRLLITNIAEPLTHLDQASQQLSAGNLDYRVEFLRPSLPAEMEVLGEKFNSMAYNLEHYNALLKKHNEDLESRVKERTRELMLKNKELAALYAVASSVSSTNQVIDVLSEVIKEITTLFGVEASSIYLNKENDDKPAHAIWHYSFTQEEKSAYAEYIAKFSRESISTGKNIVINDLEVDEKIKSLVSVPIHYKNEILGAIILGSRIVSRFGKQELNLLQAICSQLGVVIRNVSLFNEINDKHNTFLAVMNSINEGLILVDSKALIIYMNTEFMKMFDLYNIDFSSEIHMLDIPKFIDPEAVMDLPFQDLMEDFEKNRLFVHREGTFTYREKKRYYVILGFPILTDCTVIGYGFIIRDNTREKEIDQLKNNIFSTVSHELRTPLTTIQGSAESLLRKDVNWSARDKAGFTRAIIDESIRLRELIENIMDMSKIEAGSLNLDIHSTDITKVIERVVNRFKLRYKTTKIVMAPEGLLPFVLIDERRIEQVLNNLLENGIKYSPGDKKITISAFYLEEADMVTICVRDEGIGIDAKHQEVIFDRFYRVNTQLSKQVSGSGVGLAIAKGIVEAHGGSIWVTSVCDKGSNFCFTVPCE